MNGFARLLAAVPWWLSVAASAATFTVTSTNDNGAGSLRQAILDANATTGVDAIAFNVALGGLTLRPASALPVITEGVVVDGTTQPGYVGSPLIELNGQSAGAGADGLRIQTVAVTVRGLLINRFGGDGIDISGGGGHVIEGCVIGLDGSGVDQGNLLNGMVMTNSAGNRIGGASSSQRNVISGNNQNGIVLSGASTTNTLIQGNFIGLSPAGTATRNNSQSGIWINGSPSNLVGGVNPGEGNVISGNSQNGIRIEGPTASGNTVQGNVIGLDPDGSVAFANGVNGVYLLNAPSALIGGAEPGAGNLISANNGDGVRVDGTNARTNAMLGNVVGLDRLGNVARANAGSGVHFLGNATGNRVGGTNTAEGNTIWFNSGDGIFFEAGTNNLARGNSIFGNGGLGHDVGANGVTVNDNLDADTGANGLQNFPVLSAATNLPAGVFVVGALNSRANGVYGLDFYSSTARDPTGNGEGQVYLGSTEVTTDAAGSAAFAWQLPRQASGKYLSATATDTNGNTSEFSPVILIASSLPPLTFTVVNTLNSGPGSLRQAMLDANAAVTSTNDLVEFDIPGPGPHTVLPLSPLPVVSEPLTLDGFTEPDAAPNTSAVTNNAVWAVRLVGTNLTATVDGLYLDTSNCIIRGLVITGFRGSGIAVGTNSFNRIEGNLIGSDLSETNLGNGVHGVYLNQSSGNTVGGDVPFARNVISRNGQHGVLIAGAAASNNIIAGNFIGSGRDGIGDMGNTGDGVQINAAARTRVGGTDGASGNVIVGNNSDGVELLGSSAVSNLLAGNWIGVDATGGSAGNSSAGVRFNSNARSNTVGVAVAGGGNRIFNNGGGGVEVNSGTNNTVRANAIFANGGLGLDLGGGGSVLANDVGDEDAGPNLGQNYPTLSSGSVSIGHTTVVGTLASRPGADYVVDFYASEDRDASGNGEGQFWLGSASVTTGADSNAVINIELPVEASERYLTATATDASGSTSEFSPALSMASTLPGRTFTVVNTNDAGAGSLRQAILDANRAFNAGDRIEFNLAGVGPHTISPASALPIITDTVVIDGFTQPGAVANALAEGNSAVLKIRIDGAGAFGFAVDGLRVQADGCEIRGLALTGFASDGIEINGGAGNLVVGCEIGVTPDGVVQRNSTDGVHLFNAPGNRIGGANPPDRNVISGNFGTGIRFEGAGSSNGIVQGNFIGTGLAGTNAAPNAGNGVLVDASGVVIGGTTPGARNVISGNFASAIETRYENPLGVVIIGNFIGTDYTGRLAVPNQQGGVYLGAGALHRVGGPNAVERNLISGNLNSAVAISSLSSGGSLVQGNWIGLNRDGAPLTNGSTGIYLTGSSNQIGGVLAGEGNVIAYNRDGGIYVPVGTNNNLRGNRIYANDARGTTGLAVDLGASGVTPNDLGDADTGANTLQNYPVITNAVIGAASTSIRGRMNGRPLTTFMLDFYSNRSPDPSGYGEAETLLGSASVATDSAGDGLFEVTLPVSAPGRHLTAMATDPFGNSSELSAAFAASSILPAQMFTVVNTNDAGPGSLRQALLDAGLVVAASNNVVAFNIPGPGTHVIRLSSVLAPSLESVTIDGLTQPGAMPNTVIGANNAVWAIEIEGSLLGFNSYGVLLSQPGSKARGLKIRGFYNGVVVAGIPDAVVEGCFLDANANNGVLLSNAVDAVVGGPTVAAANLISGHGGAGVAIEGPAARGNAVLGNLIGSDASGSQAGGTQYNGVSILDAHDNRVGGIGPGEANLIAFQQNDGVFIQSGTNNVVRGNRIFGNASLGIDLGLTGVSDNDAGDVDEGANRLQNFPVLSAATVNPGSTRVQGTLPALPASTCTLDFYAVSEKDFSDHGEGDLWLASIQVTTDGAGQAAFDVTLPVASPSRYLSATATDALGNTSEFSTTIEPVSSLPGQTFRVTTTADAGLGSLRQALLDVSVSPNLTPDQIVFDIAGPGVKVISPLTPLPVPSQPFVVDGFTQPGARPNALTNGNDADIRVQIDGAALAFGGGAFELTNEFSTVRGLSLTRFSSSAVTLSGANQVVEGCWIGVDPAGALAGNGSAGVAIFGAGCRVGGTNAAARNVISGNDDAGIFLDVLASNAVIAGNYIGTGPQGTNRVANQGPGIWIHGAMANLIGGTNTGAGNVVSGNLEDGVLVEGSTAVSNRIQGNIIGLSPRLGRPVPNSRNGILFTGTATSNLVGGPVGSADNLIHGNGFHGVRIDSGRQNSIVGNSLVGNGGQPISIAPGANDSLPRPQVDYAHVGSTVVQGHVIDPGTNRLLRIEPVRFREIQVDDPPLLAVPVLVEESLGMGGVNTNVQPYVFRIVDPDESVPGDIVSARVHVDGSTSEEGNRVVVGLVTNVDLSIQVTSDPFVAPGADVPITITLLNRGPADCPAASTVLNLWDGRVVSFSNPSGTGGFANQSAVMTNSLAAGETESIVIRVEPVEEANEILVNTRTFSLTQVDSNDRDNYGTNVIIRVIDAADATDAGVWLSADTTQSTAGLNYQVVATARNYTTNPAPGLVLRVTSEDPIINATATQGTVNFEGHSATASLGTLGGGESAQATITVVDSRDFGPDDGWKVVAATVETTADDRDPGNNQWTIYIESDDAGGDLELQHARQTNGDLEIRWTDISGVHLQSTPSLSPPITWTPVPETQTVVEIPFRIHSVVTVTTQAVFRLSSDELVEVLDASIDRVVFDANDGFFPWSGWGRVVVTYADKPGPQYLNVAVNNNWVVQDLPVVQEPVTGGVQRVQAKIPLLPVDRAVAQVQAAITVTESPLGGPPTSVRAFTVGTTVESIDPAEAGQFLEITQPTPLIGGTVVRWNAADPGCPNVEQGRGESVPASVLNGLITLNQHYSLNLDPSLLDLNRVKTGLVWQAGTAPVGDDPANPIWIYNERRFLAEHQVPIRVHDTTDSQEALDALRDHSSVIARFTSLTANVVGLADLGGNRYSMTVAQDLLQGSPGGTGAQVLVLDLNQGPLHPRVFGNPWSPDFRQFIIQQYQP